MRIVAILAAMIIPVAVYFPVYQERDKTIERADKEIRELDTRIEQAQAAARKLPQFRDEAAKLDTELVKLRRILPPDPALNEIRELVDTTARTSAIHIDRLQPRGATRHDYVETPIDIEATGTLEALEAFFSRLAVKFRIIDVSKVTLLKEPGGVWRTKCVMMAYSLPD
jgi:Tfp pilus assembly protein PilO